MVVEIPLHIEIRAPAAKVFATYTNLPDYDRWLPQSDDFKGTTNVSTNPMRVGTTYVETSPSGVRYGEVTEYEEPTKVTFHQPMTLKPAFLGLVLDITVRNTITENRGVSSIDRVVTLGIPWTLLLLKSYLIGKFRSESQRTLETMKKYLEGQP